jgi:hypothetical protein
VDISWSPKKGRGFDELYGRVKRHLKRLELMGVDYDRTGLDR